MDRTQTSSSIAIVDGRALRLRQANREDVISVPACLRDLLPPECVIRAMPTGDSDGCRPPVPGHADHVFQSHGVHFSGTPESVDAMRWIAWTPCSGILGRT